MPETRFRGRRAAFIENEDVRVTVLKEGHHIAEMNLPWNGETLTRGMEFGVSPMPESRQTMVDRGRLFDVPTYRWLPANGRIEVEYYAIIQRAESIPEVLEWPAR